METQTLLLIKSTTGHKNDSEILAIYNYIAKDLINEIDNLKKGYFVLEFNDIATSGGKHYYEFPKKDDGSPYIVTSIKDLFLITGGQKIRLNATNYDKVGTDFDGYVLEDNGIYLTNPRSGILNIFVNYLPSVDDNPIVLQQAENVITQGILAFVYETRGKPNDSQRWMNEYRASKERLLDKLRTRQTQTYQDTYFDTGALEYFK